MWLKRYIDENKYILLLSSYDVSYLNNIDYNKFIKVYNVFKANNFYFIDDIILNYLEIFEIDDNIVRNKLMILKRSLGENYVYLIGNDMRLLEFILKK